MATDGNGEQTPSKTLAEIRSVIARAKTGDATAVPELRAILDRNPSLVRHFGDLSRQAEGAWIALASGSNLYLKETAVRAAEVQRAELTRPGAQPVEKLLVERVVACGIQLNYFSATEANALDAGDTPKQLQFHAKRLAQAQRMHLAALSALVAYQKLVPVPVAAGTDRVTASTEHQERPLAQNSAERQARAEVLIEVDSDAVETGQENQERLRVGVVN